MNRTSSDLELTPQLRLSGFQMSFERNELTVPKLSALCLRRIASFARADALVEESALHRVARQSERCSEVLARRLVPPTPKLKLAERGVVERIAREAIRVSDSMYLFEPAFRTFVLRDGDGPVQCYDWRRTNGQQLVIE